MVVLISNVRPDGKKTMQVPETLGPIAAWSFSTLKVFEECAYRLYIQKVKKIPEPQGPQAARGETIHKAAEDYIQGLTDTIIPELKHVAKVLEDLRELFKEQGKVSVEGEWAFTKEWVPTGWMSPDCWARIKLDVLVYQTPTSARVIDWKSGKKFGNEVTHGQQGLLYAIGAFMRDPQLEFCDVEFYYTDQNEITKKSYTREQALMFLPGFHS